MTIKYIGLPLLILSLLVASNISAQERDESSPHTLILGNREGKTSFNDDMSLVDLGEPYLYYQWKNEDDRLRAIIAGLYNKFEYQLGLTEKYGFFANTTSRLTRAGDSPRIDGVELNLFKFKAHSVGGEIGAYSNLARRLSLRGGLRADYFYIYNRPTGSITFTSPENFLEMGAFLSFLYGKSGAPTELVERGFRAHLHNAVQGRQGHKTWGTTGFSKKIGQYYEGSLGFSYARPMIKPLYWSLAAQGSLLSKADRLNGIRDGALHQRSTKMFLGDIKTVRSFTTEAGLRWYALKKKYLAVKPFGHFATYREITPTAFRNNKVYGPGLSLMGQLNDFRFLWDLTYGIGFGNRSDIDALHDIKISLSYRFI